MSQAGPIRRSSQYANDPEAACRRRPAASVRPAAQRVDIYIRPGSLRQQLVEAWGYRDVAWSLIREQLTWRRGARLKLGLWWHPIRIVFGTLVFALIFGGVLGAPSEGDVPYFLFVTASMCAFWIFQHATLASKQSFYRFKHYVNNFSFPLVLIPLVGMAYLWLGTAFFFAYLLASFLVFWAIDGTFYLHVSPDLLLAPLSALWLVALAVTVGLFTAPVFKHAKDVRNVYRLVLPFLMFVTPVIYPLSSLGGTAAAIAGANPLTAPVELFRQGLFGVGGVPLYSLLSAIATTIILLACGLLFLRRVGTRLLWTEARTSDFDDEDL